MRKFRVDFFFVFMLNPRREIVNRIHVHETGIYYAFDILLPLLVRVDVTFRQSDILQTISCVRYQQQLIMMNSSDNGEQDESQFN